MVDVIKKREGYLVPFDQGKIYNAILAAMDAVGERNEEQARKITDHVIYRLEVNFEKRTPSVEEIQDIVEDQLIEASLTKVARAYIIYRNKRNELRKKIMVRNEEKVYKNTTEMSLLVSTSTKELVTPWDRNKIIEALIKESQLSPGVAQKIAKKVEEKIFNLNFNNISTTLIRELVDNELFTRGYEKKWEKQKIIGMPTYDLKRLFLSKTQENSNIATNNPEAINLAIAENSIKQYMLQEVFSREVADAHLRGIIHIHDLGYPRIYCSGHSLEYIKKFGLNLDNLDTSSSPAKYARTLTGHLNTFLSSMQAYYAGALGIAYLNIFYAPYLVGMSYQEIKQEAQYLIFSGSQNAFSRGGQSLFLDFNVHLGIPEHLKEVPAIGPGGKYTGKTYQDYKQESQQFLKALMEVWEEGDSHGKVFAFPKMDLHINEESFQDPSEIALLKYACHIASENGTPYFIFDRDSISLSACCRLKNEITDLEMIKKPEKLRFSGIQNVTINLPQCAYRTLREERSNQGELVSEQEIFTRFFDKIDIALKLVIKAHQEKKIFLKQLMSSPEGPLWQIGKISPDGKPYVDLEKGTYLVGLIGLNEAIQYLTNYQLHENENAYLWGLKTISFLHLKCKEYSQKYGMILSLEESPAESAAGRLAKIDLREFPESEKVIKGNISEDECYYTNSIHFAASAEVDLITRIVQQSKFHPLIKSGAIIHAFVGEQKPSQDSIFNLIYKVWENTLAAQITISPEFTVCNQCRKISRGLQDFCSYCHSDNVYGITRIVGYYSKINNWNKNKIGELKDRKLGNYQIV
ncbi:MAG: anaerobic ribonucleoside-triphosphate reductase [Atribacterota bacterium]|nr:anaerobic ribonucleoside-triphosphate reductase [Candidatus Atribacteria bacterium]MDD3538915.1 anaerobic ribonucleoside-triphosphate reductase [Atribacterota bacterium]MDD5497439.1 anaerobic ribonucleoside-triphosphate reductase [Atribacterota bacterium]